MTLGKCFENTWFDMKYIGNISVQKDFWPVNVDRINNVCKPLTNFITRMESRERGDFYIYFIGSDVCASESSMPLSTLPRIFFTRNKYQIIFYIKKSKNLKFSSHCTTISCWNLQGQIIYFFACIFQVTNFSYKIWRQKIYSKTDIVPPPTS